jgi:hypothetical protein
MAGQTDLHTVLGGSGLGVTVIKECIDAESQGLLACFVKAALLAGRQVGCALFT